MGAFALAVIWIGLSFSVYLPVNESKVHPSIAKLSPPYIGISNNALSIGESREMWIRANQDDELIWLTLLYPPKSENVKDPPGKLYLGSFDGGILIDENQYPMTRRKMARIIEQHPGCDMRELITMFKVSKNPFDLTRCLVRYCVFKLIDQVKRFTP